MLHVSTISLNYVAFNYISMFLIQKISEPQTEENTYALLQGEGQCIFKLFINKHTYFNSLLLLLEDSRQRKQWCINANSNQLQTDTFIS